MREVVVSSTIIEKLSDIKNYLKNDLKVSQEAALAYNDRFLVFIESFSSNVDYPKCRFKKWCTLGYRCAIFEKDWVFAYEVVPEGVIVRDMSHTALLTE